MSDILVEMSDMSSNKSTYHVYAVVSKLYPLHLPYIVQEYSLDAE